MKRVLFPVLFILLLSGVLVSAQSSITIFDEALPAGWQDWSWNTTVNLNGSPAHSGSKSIATTFTNAWAGLYLRSMNTLPAGYDILRFWINGGQSGGQQIGFYFFDASNNPTEGAVLTLQANAWTQIDVPVGVFGSSDRIAGLVWQDRTGGSQPVFYVDDVQLVASGIPPTSPPTQTGLALTIDAAAGQHAISPYIYGLNFADPTLAADIRLPVNRWGGNATTRYNWQNDTSNRASDWFFENIPNDNSNPSALPNGSSSDQFVAVNHATGTDTIMTVPLIGWTPKSREYACGFSVAQYGAQQSVDPYRPDCGNGVRSNGQNVTGNNPADTSIAISPTFVQDWIRHLQGQFGVAGQGGVRFYNLDNEPALWNSTHRDVRPQALGYDELRDLTYQYAAAIKAVDPNAQTLGPVEWGWTAYFYSALDAAAGGAWWNNPVDRNAHGGQELTAWYLDQMRLYEQQHSVRILDYLDLHYYPQAQGVALSPAGGALTQALRLRTTRSLWDPTYVDESWIGEAVRLIPRMRDWVNQHYPGTKLAITEYNFGALDHINGALTQADVLGIFGREGLDLATVWDPPGPTDPGAYAFRMYRNYDGQGGQFGETGVQTSSSDQSQLAVYAASRSDGALTIMVINKTGATQSSPVTIGNFSANGTAEVYRYSTANLNQIVRESDLNLNSGVINGNFPPNSISLLVIRSGNPVNTPTPPPSSTPGPTLTATPTVTATAEPTIEPSVEPTTEPSVEPTIEPTNEPTLEPTLTLTSTPSSTEPGVTVEVSPASANIGDSVSIALKFSDISDLYGFEATCRVDPAVLAGTGHVEGDIFTSANSFIVDAGYQSDGSWLVAASLLAPQPAFSGSGTAIILNYNVINGGSTAVDCDVLPVDINAQVKAVTVTNDQFTGNGQPTPITTEEPPTPVLTVVPSATAEPSATPLPTMTFTPLPPDDLSSIHGTAARQANPNQSGITVQLWRSDSSRMGELVTGADGGFTFTDVPPGLYGLVIWSPQHLTVTKLVEVNANGQVYEVGQLVMPTGDTDGNQVIDLLDASFIGANFRLPVPPAPANADMNGDGMVNIVDLTLVGINFGRTGPVALP